VPGTAAGITLAFADTEGSATGTLLPTGTVRDTVDGVEVTCVDNGMPVVLALASSFGLTGHEGHEELAADAALLDRIDGLRTKAGALMGLGDVTEASVPKTVLLSAPADGGHVATRSFIPVRPHTSIGVLAAVSVVTGMLLPGAVGHELTAGWPRDRSQVDVEHPTGHLLVDVVVDADAEPPRVLRSGVVRTARKLFDGTAFPRA
jgi:4-oxalomesaconate tautomerase